MKYKRIDILVPYETYDYWERYFNSNITDIDTYSSKFNIDGDTFKIDFLENNFFKTPLIEINISNNKNKRIYESKLNNVAMLMVQPHPFIYDNIQYIFDLKIEKLSIFEKVRLLKDVSNNPKWLKEHITTLNINDEQDIMDVAFALSYIKYEDNETIRIEEEKKELLDLFLKKLSYYGFEFKDYDYISNIEVFADKTKEEIIKKEIAFIDFLSNKINKTNYEKIEIINRASKKLYEHFTWLNTNDFEKNFAWLKMNDSK